MNEDCAIIWLIMLLHLLLDHSYPYLSFLSLLHLFLRSPTIPPSLCLILKPLGIMIMHTEPYHSTNICMQMPVSVCCSN